MCTLTVGNVSAIPEAVTVTDVAALVLGRSSVRNCWRPARRRTGRTVAVALAVTC
ncbi:hypothetical protein ACFU7X_12175 [Streptomyces chartreusis]|uniref:hypothetical protein n=1 Tax=Streptomyces chartreusis TaxID=1969 RepID=UPI0036BF3D4A